MLYEKSLKQLNAVFPKLSIKPPVKKAIIRPIVQQIDAPYLSSADFQLLRDPQTASKPLQKLVTLLQTWIRVLENNERARQQQQRFQDGPGNRDKIEQLHEVLVDAEQVSTAEEFVLFITQKGQQLYRGKVNTKSVKDYLETLIPKQREFYNTISPISEEQYFNLLEQVMEKLNILEQVVKNQITNMDYLVDLHNMVDSEDIFKKKDNIFNKRALGFAAQMEADRKTVYYYQEQITFAVARGYYLLYLAEKDLSQNDSEAFLDEIESYLCYKREQVFPKLYNNLITLPLILMQQKRISFMQRKYPQNQIAQSQLGTINSKIASLHQFLVDNDGKLLNEQQFLDIYPEVQSLLIKTSQQLKADRENQKYKQNRLFLIESQREVLRLFVNDGGEADNKSNYRRVLGEANSRLSGKSYGFQKSHTSQSRIINSRYTQKTNKTNSNPEKQIKPNMLASDLGKDIFLQFVPQTSAAERKLQVQALSKNEEQYEKQCRDYLQKIKPSFGEILDDAENFRPEELLILDETGSLASSGGKEKQILSLINRNLIKPEISEQNLHKIFQPALRFNVLKLLSQKLVELAYKNSKIIDSPSFETLPENLKQFIQLRSSFLKVVNKQFDKIIGIGEIVVKLPFQTRYDICKYESYETFLKVLLATKQARSYELSFKDEKKISRETSLFVQKKIYSPFISSLIQLLPPPYHQPGQIVQALDELEFFNDFLHRTEEILAETIENLAEKTGQEIDFQRADLARILGSWVRDAEEKLKMRKQIFKYESAEAQLIKLNEVIRVCNNERRGEIKDPTALRIAKLIEPKL